MSLTIFGTEIPTNMDSLEVFGKDMDELEVFGVTVWKKQKYHYISFNSNGGTGSMPDQTMPAGTLAALAENAFSKIGYLFTGWSLDAQDDTADYTDRQQVKDIAPAGETAILYAIWRAITWYVKFNPNGGSGSMDYQLHTYDTAKKLTANKFTRPGYKFLGWGTSQAGAVVYQDEAEVKNLKSTHGATLSLYALWQRATAVLFDTNDTTTHQWYRGSSPANGWGKAACALNGSPATWDQIDCTDFKTCTVRIKGQIDTEPSGTTADHVYIKVGFTDDHTQAVEVVHRWAGSAIGSGQNGVAYNKWYDLVLDVSHLTGVQSLNVFVGGAYQNGGSLFCSKIIMSN